MIRIVSLTLAAASLAILSPILLAAETQLRPTDNPDELRFWLENMVVHHRYTAAEVESVTGLSREEQQQKLNELGIDPAAGPTKDSDRLRVLPYPGGRHPRIGFLDGAIEPQRETKLSAFAPWDDTSYAVLDVPEAIWSNLGLTYLAHTHVPTIWTQQQVTLPTLEWQRRPDGSYVMQRHLPNGIVFGTRAVPKKDHLQMEMWLKNGTNETLSDLRVQNCVMLKGMKGFTEQTNENKQFIRGYAVVHGADKSRWVISSWAPNHRTWGNTKCPCMHSDPKFEDCPPGETRWLRGWFSFYQGTDIEAELARIENLGWKERRIDVRSGNLIGVVADGSSGAALASRLYVQRLDDQSWHYARTAARTGQTVEYRKQRGAAPSIEKHTSVSAHPFQLHLPPGRYRIEAVRGKEYLPAETIVELSDSPQRVELSLTRFANMNARGWYSGDTHVHRELWELPTVMQSEDLNVALPLTHWVRDSREIPADSGPTHDPAPIYVDPSHVIYPVNTEYEIFSIDGQRHTQGAVFVLGHQQPFTLKAPPVREIARQARQQGALLDLDKHSWNWSLMIIPIMDVDLFELSNNHNWRTTFGFPNWTIENAPRDWPEIETDDRGFTERGWTNFAMQTYYTLLNCGFRMRVSAGTASGVHPVPLGHGRVYVHTGEGLDYEQWMQNLDAGHSFVSTGPLLDVRFNGELPGTTFTAEMRETTLGIRGEIRSRRPLERIELIVNGDIAKQIPATSTQLPGGGLQTKIESELTIDGTGWVALRCFEQHPEGAVRFAHTNPVFVDNPDHPLRPSKRRLEYFIRRIEAEIDRNAGVLSDEAMAEYHQALRRYQELHEAAE